MQKSILVVFPIVYALSWGLAAYRPGVGLLCLVAVGTVISIPLIVERAVCGLLLSSVMVMLAVALPPLAPILALWPLCRFAYVMWRNARFSIASILLYYCLACFPTIVRASAEAAVGTRSVYPVPLIIFLSGFLLAQCISTVYGWLGLDKRSALKFALFFPAFCVMLLLLILNVDTACDTDD